MHLLYDRQSITTGKTWSIFSKTSQDMLSEQVYLKKLQSLKKLFQNFEMIEKNI